MASIFITGSADGLGQLAAKALAEQGHQVVLHARNAERGRQAMGKVPGAAHAVVGDLSDGPGAPDDLQEGFETQTWLAVSDDSRAKVSGRYFHHRAESRCNPQAGDAPLQERFLSLCGNITGVTFAQ